MLYLITGHKGWLGGHFLKLMNDKQNEVLTINDDLSCDLSKLKVNDEFIIVHFAGYKNNDIELSLKNNIIVTTQLVRLSCKKKCKGIIFLSSIAVLGKTCGIVDDNTIIKPVSIYGKSKYICEEIIKMACTNHVIIRPTNIVEGINVGILNQIYDALSSGNDYHIWKESMNSKRDYVAVNDVIDCIYNIAIQMSNNSDAMQQIFNLGSGYSYNIAEIIKLIECRTNRKLNMIVESNPKFISYNLQVNNKRVLDVLERTPMKLETLIEQNM